MRIVYTVCKIRTEGQQHFGSMIPVADCDNEKNAQRIVDALEKHDDDRILFEFGVIKREI